MKGWGALTIEAGVSAKLVNNLENQCHGVDPIYPDEAMYVDGPVALKLGATLDLNGVNLITTQAVILLGGAQITGAGDVIVVASKTCFGDFDNNGVIDDDEEDVILAAINTGNCLTDNVLCDFNLDQKVGLLDVFRFNRNRTAGCVSVCGGESASGGGGGGFAADDIEAMAAWSNENMTAAQRAEFAQDLLDIVEEHPAVPDAPQMLQLAAMLDE